MILEPGWYLVEHHPRPHVAPKLRGGGSWRAHDGPVLPKGSASSAQACHKLGAALPLCTEPSGCANCGRVIFGGSPEFREFFRVRADIGEMSNASRGGCQPMGAAGPNFEAGLSRRRH